MFHTPGPVRAIPLLQDNYAWTFEIAPGLAAVVDPGDAAPVIAYLQDTGQTLGFILLTHHHRDHIAGAKALQLRYGAVILGAGADSHRLPPLDHQLFDGDTPLLRGKSVEGLATPLTVQVLALPGHTTGHLGYRLGQELFVGDVLFGCGCGRLFEGTPAQMWATLQRLMDLPGDTRLYPGHEYTLANLRFALSLEPHNPALRQLEGQVYADLDAGRPTLPTTLARELRVNPFLRAGEPGFAAHLGLAEQSPLAVFTWLRERRNHFQ